MAQSPKKKNFKYTYTSLESLTAGTGVVNIYGVVKYSNPNRETVRGGKYYKTIGVYNDALWQANKKYTLTIFSSSKEGLPDCRPGNIIRLHRLQLENFNNCCNGKLQMDWGGAWVMFGDADGYIPLSASSKDPSWCADEETIITNLRDWLHACNPGDDVDNNDINAQPRIIVSSQKDRNPVNTDTWIRGVALNSFFCVKCQLLQRSVLVDKGDKLALLKVWDGTRPRLQLNKPSMEGFATETHDCGVVEQLSEFCVTLVVYGDHVSRAKQLKLGGVYKFTGVHCVEYVSVGKPELYLHERNRSLAAPLSESEKETLVDQLCSAVVGIDNAVLDITSDLRSVKELDDELSNVLSAMRSPSKNNNAISERECANSVQLTNVGGTTSFTNGDAIPSLRHIPHNPTQTVSTQTAEDLEVANNVRDGNKENPSLPKQPPCPPSKNCNTNSSVLTSSLSKKALPARKVTNNVVNGSPARRSPCKAAIVRVEDEIVISGCKDNMTMTSTPTKSPPSDSSSAFQTDKDGVHHHYISRETLYCEDISKIIGERLGRSVVQEPDEPSTKPPPRTKSAKEILREYKRDNYLLECLITGSDLRIPDPPAEYFDDPVSAASAAVKQYRAEYM